jgi:hypothetical protein
MVCRGFSILLAAKPLTGIASANRDLVVVTVQEAPRDVRSRITLLSSGHVTGNTRFVFTSTSHHLLDNRMTSSHVSSGHPTPSSSSSPHVAPLISERYLDIPSQRLYALSFALLIQVGAALVDPRVDNFPESAIYRP